MLRCILWVIIVTQYVGCEQFSQLPSGLKRCVPDENMDVCIRENTQTALPYLKNGIPEQNIPPLDPIGIDVLEIESVRTDGNLCLYFLNSLCTGLASVTVTGVEALQDTDNLKITLKVFAPKLHVVGTYDINGILIGRSVNGKGNFTLNFDKIDGTLVFNGKLIEKEKKTYISIYKVDLYYTPALAILQLDNIFNSNTQTEEFNEDLSKNWQEVHDEIQPSYTKGLEPLYQQYANSILENLPYDKIFKKD